MVQIVRLHGGDILIGTLHHAQLIRNGNGFYVKLVGTWDRAGFGFVYCPAGLHNQIDRLGLFDDVGRVLTNPRVQLQRWGYDDITIEMA